MSDHVSEESDAVPSVAADPLEAAPEVTLAEESSPVEEPEQVEEPSPVAEADPIQLRMRRAPRYRAFGLTGAALGVLAGVILALSFTASSDYSIRTIVGYFAAILGLIGALAGLTIAVLLERRRA